MNVTGTSTSSHRSNRPLAIAFSVSFIPGAAWARWMIPSAVRAGIRQGVAWFVQSATLRRARFLTIGRKGAPIANSGRSCSLEYMAWRRLAHRPAGARAATDPVLPMAASSSATQPPRE